MTQSKTGRLEVAPGVALHYRVAGEGRPLVMIPGWIFTTEVFEHQFARFAETHHVVSFDPRSHGRSTVTTTGNDYVTQAADLRALLDHLGLEMPILAGWSFGCLTLWEYVRAHGTESIAGAVCIDLSPTPMTENKGDWREGSVADLAGAFGMLRTVEGHAEFVTGYADEVMIDGGMTPETLDWVLRQSLATPPWAASAYFAAGMFSNQLDMAKAIDAVDLPYLYVVAEHWADTARDYLSKHAPGAQLEILGGHLMFWQHPERFNPILRRFLETVGP